MTCTALQVRGAFRLVLGARGQDLMDVPRVPLLLLGGLDRQMVIGLGTDGGRIGLRHLPGRHDLLDRGAAGTSPSPAAACSRSADQWAWAAIAASGRASEPEI